MSNEAKETIKLVKAGNLPPLAPANSSKNSSGNAGTQQSQRDVQKLGFGLQALNEGADFFKDNK